MSLSVGGRALHWVFKVADRTKTVSFLKNVLGMKTLRHEEFQEGCEAACNGKYDGRWSKTMIGFGEEDTHFVLELTYNYGIKSYQKGNDFQYITIKSKAAYQNASTLVKASEITDDNHLGRLVKSPDGYVFRILNEDPVDNGDPVSAVTLQVKDLKESLGQALPFERDALGMKLVEERDQGRKASLSFSPDQASLELVESSDKGADIDHAEAYGRIAFSCPKDQLLPIQEYMKEHNRTIIKSFVSLDTPGKATVQVVILGDPDGYEICFVGDEGFRELSKFDKEGDHLLEAAIAEDDSVEYLEKKKKLKLSAEQ